MEPILKTHWLRKAASLAIFLLPTSLQANAIESSFFQHDLSGLCLAATENAINPNKKSQLTFEACDETSDTENQFRWLKNGSIQHIASGRCIKPEGKLNDVNALDRLELAPRCGGKKLAFSQKKSGVILHDNTGLCFNPEGQLNQLTSGTRLLLNDKCGKKRAAFTVTADIINDGDGDGVIDSDDRCPNTSAGVDVDVFGCEIFNDSDFDGFSDADDACPFQAGPTLNRGCPPSPTDADNDGIENPFDVCRFTPPFATVDDEGCDFSERFIDDDGDGVVNAFDLCPGTPAEEFPSLNPSLGCSIETQFLDDDNDRLSNVFDRCPDEAGFPGLNGCPLERGANDSDQDGIPDEVDECKFTPQEFQFFGVNTNNGCLAGDPEFPFEDLDGDRVINDQDLCDTRGFPIVDAEGCDFGERDSDFDGVNNFRDQCPDTPEFTEVDESGCAIVVSSSSISSSSASACGDLVAFGEAFYEEAGCLACHGQVPQDGSTIWSGGIAPVDLFDDSSDGYFFGGPAAFGWLSEVMAGVNHFTGAPLDQEQAQALSAYMANTVGQPWCPGDFWPTGSSSSSNSSVAVSSDSSSVVISSGSSSFVVPSSSSSAVVVSSTSSFVGSVSSSSSEPTVSSSSSGVVSSSSSGVVSSSSSGVVSSSSNGVVSSSSSEVVSSSSSSSGMAIKAPTIITEDFVFTEIEDKPI